MSSTTGDLSPADPLLDRFAVALARIVHDERPEALSRPVTVAELYQDIAPYRRMRELASIELHADYEHALIRFLAGEGGFAQLDPTEAADELGIEAESSDPDLSLYRKFAACDVRLSLARPSGPAPARRVELPPVEPLRPLATRPKPDIGKPEALKAEAPKAEPNEAPRSEPAPSLAETMRALELDPAPAPGKSTPAQKSAPRAAPAAAKAAPRCAFCGQGLPGNRQVRYCPHCGVDLTARQCGACGEEMEDGWRFCVACGAAAES